MDRLVVRAPELLRKRGLDNSHAHRRLAALATIAVSRSASVALKLRPRLPPHNSSDKTEK